MRFARETKGDILDGPASGEEDIWKRDNGRDRDNARRGVDIEAIVISR